MKVLYNLSKWEPIIFLSFLVVFIPLGKVQLNALLVVYLVIMWKLYQMQKNWNGPRLLKLHYDFCAVAIVITVVYTVAYLVIYHWAGGGL